MRILIAVMISAAMVCAGTAFGADKGSRKHAPMQVIKNAPYGQSQAAAASEPCQEEPSLHQFYPEEVSRCQVTTLGKGKTVVSTANLKGKKGGPVATPASLVSPIPPTAITLASASASQAIRPAAGVSMTIQQMVEDAQAKAAAHYNVPPHILTAIKRVESRGHPYAIGVNLGRDKNGKVQSYPIYPKTYEDAVRHLNSLKTDNVDIGPWQVNYKHIGKHHGVSKVDLLNPYISGALAAWKLATEIQASGYTWNAVGSYHNRSDLQRKAWYVGHVKKELRKAGLFDLDATLLVLGKIAIVMSAPAIAGFVLFGQKGHFQGMSGVSGIVGGAAAAAVMMAGRAAAGAATGGAGAAAGGAAGGAAATPAGLPPGATPVTGATGGGQGAGRGGVSATDVNRTPSGMIESAPTVDGPVNYTTPGSRQARQEQDAEAIAAMRDHASGSSPLEPGSRMVSSDGGGAYTGTVSNKGFAGAMAQQCTEAVNGGASVGLMSSGGGVTSGVVASRSADGGLSFAPMNAANAGDVAMAQSLNRGEAVHAVYMPKGTSMTANDAGMVSFAPIRNGKEMANATAMEPKDALKNLSRMNV